MLFTSRAKNPNHGSIALHGSNQLAEQILHMLMTLQTSGVRFEA